MTLSSGSASPPPTTRQRPGAACEECRRRKLRCDGQKPQCGFCRESRVACEVDMHRALRGPKKGYLKVLKDRVGIWSFLKSFIFVCSRSDHGLFQSCWRVVLWHSSQPGASSPIPCLPPSQIPPTGRLFLAEPIPISCATRRFSNPINCLPPSQISPTGRLFLA